MAYSYQRHREEFIARMVALRLDNMSAEGAADIARLILRDASTMQRISEVQCSFEISEREAARLARQDAAAEKRVAVRLAPFLAPLRDARIQFGGDPRGCPVTIEYVNARGYPETIHVPGRSLPARCFA